MRPKQDGGRFSWIESQAVLTEPGVKHVCRALIGPDNSEGEK